MTEDIARSIGTPDPHIFVINGKEVQLRGLDMEDLTSIEREIVLGYRRDYLNALKEDIGEFVSKEEYREEVRRSATWGPDDLPKKSVYDAGRFDKVDAAIDWMEKNAGFDPSVLDGYEPQVVNRVVRRMLAQALDQERLKPEECYKLTGVRPVEMKTGYVNWYVTGTPSGMIMMIHRSLKDQGVTKDDVLKYLGTSQEKMVDLSRTVEKLTSPASKNG